MSGLFLICLKCEKRLRLDGHQVCDQCWQTHLDDIAWDDHDDPDMDGIVGHR
jgi:hypothetical protein